jgi:hypothetical protein
MSGVPGMQSPACWLPGWTGVRGLVSAGRPACNRVVGPLVGRRTSPVAGLLHEVLAVLEHQREGSRGGCNPPSAGQPAQLALSIPDRRRST